ncbi:6-phosphogluconolactonase [Pseudogracilibacillus sp. SE30717A]|uniref:6-phosphogluconolactonase n=1 Tax=Pseudogracilibacillus sp. SE30717A TaxID=3098293 RepID=UPI00300E44EF
MSTILHEGKKDKLNYFVCSNRDEMGKLAAQFAANKIKEMLAIKDEVRIIFACAPSQNETLHYLTEDDEIDWSRIVGFHMDEYIGLPADSDQRFSIYIENHLVNKVKMKEFHFIDGTKDAAKMEELYTTLLTEKPIDLVCLGIGENGHIAFNDPPVADFNDPQMVKVVELDEYSRRQQVNDGCFQQIQDVPTHALTLTIPALTSASTMVCTVPGPTKKEAVSNVLHDSISTACPATILREHNDAYLVLDKEAYGGE